MLSMVPSLCLLLFFAKTCGIDDCARNSINNHIDIMIQNIEKGQDDEIVSTLADVKVMSEEERERKRIAALEFGKQAREPHSRSGLGSNTRKIWSRKDCQYARQPWFRKPPATWLH